MTCYHVWEKFKALRLIDPGLMFSVCLDIFQPITINNIDARLVDEDKKCDLVTFDFEDLEHISLSASGEFFNLNQHPPPKIKKDELLYLIGFPGRDRVENQESIGFARQGMAITAQQVGDFSFFANLDGVHKQADDYGGISGCPCFAVNENTTIRLVGFVTGYVPNKFNMLVCTYAKFINSDGIISQM